MAAVCGHWAHKGRRPWCKDSWGKHPMGQTGQTPVATATLHTVGIGCGVHCGASRQWDQTTRIHTGQRSANGVPCNANPSRFRSFPTSSPRPLPIPIPNPVSHADQGDRPPLLPLILHVSGECLWDRRGGPLGLRNVAEVRGGVIQLHLIQRAKVPSIALIVQ